jgi:beta-phosphoglucomutase-like phosphatase (HAD superfamily)
MIAVITDWDGVVLRTELAKALGWTVAALRMRGVFDEALFRGITDPVRSGESAREALAHVQSKYGLELRQACGLAGQSRESTRRSVCRLLLSDADASDETALQMYRNEIKDALILHIAEPITGTIEFLSALHDKHVPLGLVTHATSTDVAQQASSCAVPLVLFGVMECAGDPFYSRMSETTDRKTVAYAIACRRLGVSPGETIAVEDSDSGLESAAAAGLTCVGVRDTSSEQRLTLATLVVSDLRHLASDEIVTLIADGNAADAVVSNLRGRRTSDTALY